MKEVIPFASLSALVEALDDGGSLFDPFSRRGDGEISTGEARSVIPPDIGFRAKKTTVALHLALLASTLPKAEQAALPAVLSDRLFRSLEGGGPTHCQPRTIANLPRPATVLTDGVLKTAPRHDQATPFWVTNANASFAMLNDRASALEYEYGVWRLYGDTEEQGSVLVLTEPSVRVPENRSVRIAAEVKTLRHDDGSDIVYLEPVFYWDRSSPPRTKMPRGKSVFDPLREALAHTPDSGERS